AECFLRINLYSGECDVGRGVLVLLHHLAVVHLVDVVAGKNEDVFGLLRADGVNILVYGVGRPLIPLIADPLHRRQHFDEIAQFAGDDIPAFADVPVEGKSLVLGEDVNAPQIGVDAVGKGDVNDAVDAAKGDCGLGPIASERVETFSGATGQQDSEGVF